MDKEEILVLYKKGVDAWNSWANERLALKTKLKEDGQWQIDIHKDGLNQATKGWIADSRIDFFQHTFEDEMNFSDFIFPYHVTFYKAELRGNTWFNGATFSEYAEFNNTTFSGNALFTNVTFRRKVNFVKTTFAVYTDFGNATFSGDAWFTNATFRRSVIYKNAAFSGDVKFNLSSFEGNTSFQGTTFEKESSFLAIKGQSFFSFSGTKFLFIPDFNQAHFIEAPQFDNSDFSKALNYKQPKEGDNLSSCWRSLKRLAIQGHDHERELIFFSEEIKSQRDKQDKAWPNPLNYLNNKPVWPGGTRYWFGYLYQYSSDFGRSVMWPIFWLLFLVVLFYCIYLKYPIEDKPTHSNPKTQATISCERSKAAIDLSVRSALPFLPAAGYSENINQSYACLYGKSSAGKVNMPNVVVSLMIVQSILSTILVFLLLLALRNHFRIK